MLLTRVLRVLEVEVASNGFEGVGILLLLTGVGEMMSVRILHGLFATDRLFYGDTNLTSMQFFPAHCRALVLSARYFN